MVKNPFYILALFYCGVLFWMSSQSHPPQPEWDFPGRDKVAHMALYAVLAGLITLGMRRSKSPIRPKMQYIIPVVFVAVYGMSDEIHQLFVPMRSCDMLDWAADIAGAILAQVFFCSFLWGLPWTETNSPPESL